MIHYKYTLNLQEPLFIESSGCYLYVFWVWWTNRFRGLKIKLKHLNDINAAVSLLNWKKKPLKHCKKKLIRTISPLSPIIAILIVDFYCYANRYTSPIYGRDYYSCFTASNSPEHVTLDGKICRNAFWTKNNMTTTALIRNFRWKTKQNRLKSRHTYFKKKKIIVERFKVALG